MNEISVISLIVGAAGILFIVLGIPLKDGRVRPNYLYGCRTRRTLSNEAIRYKVNCALGTDLIRSGILITVAAAVTWIARGSISMDFAAALLTILALSAAGFAAFRCFSLQRQ